MTEQNRTRHLIAFTLLSILFSPPLMTDPQAHEFAMKALYIKKFNNYIEWPEWKINDQSKSTFRIGIIGKNPIFGKLKYVFKETVLFQKKVSVEYANKPDEYSEFNIIFISSGQLNQIPRLVEIAKKHCILLIGDTPGYAEAGVHINFFIRKTKLRFQINRKSLLRSKLSASSFLLSLAVLVEK